VSPEESPDCEVLPALQEQRHNTKECRKYDKDVKAVAATGKKPYEKKPYKKDGGLDFILCGSPFDIFT
jgi:hypothetical protein